MMDNYCVYMHIVPNGKVYIGRTCKKPAIRWNNGKGYFNSMFGRAVQKYGWDNIKHEVLFTGLSRREACDMESHLIARYRSTDPDYGYNMTLGGDGTCGYHHREDSKEKMRQRALERGISEELRQKLNASKKGKKLSEEAKQKIREWHLGRPRSEETKRKLREVRGERHWAFGKHFSEERRKNMSESANAQKRLILCVETGVIYNGVREASRQTGVGQPHITGVCRGYRKSAGGFHWQYADEVRT